ncbi:MAG TPA: hypothetical protein ENH82_10865 [bacterium]|nr:hypothetical protein [bacterium]
MSNSYSPDISPQLTALTAEVDANEALLNLIRGTDIPAIQANIDVNETKIDDIIAAIPQKVRGDLTEAYDANTTSSWQDIVNISNSQGILNSIATYLGAGITDVQLRVTLDGFSSTLLTISDVAQGLCIYRTVYTTGTSNFYLAVSTSVFTPLNIEFSSSLRIEHRLNTGAGTLETRALYSLDNF